MNYTPTQLDREWARITLDTINDGGVIVYPATGLQYRVNHTLRTLMLLNPSVLSKAFDSNWTHNATKATFESVGYRVYEAHRDIVNAA